MPLTPSTYWLGRLADEIRAGRAEHGRFDSLPEAYGRIMLEWRELVDEIHAFDPHEQSEEEWRCIGNEALQVAAMAMRIILELSPQGACVPVLDFVRACVTCGTEVDAASYCCGEKIETMQAWQAAAIRRYQGKPA